MNIPIFRAKKIGSDEYIIGYLKFDRKHNHYSINPIDDGNTWHKIDVTTLAIHFENMIDIKGDKIFASLQEDGKGGDILFDMEYEFTLIFDGLKFRLEGLYSNTEINEYDKFTDFDSIGIQQ